MKNSSLYQEEGIVLNKSWNQNSTEIETDDDPVEENDTEKSPDTNPWNKTGEGAFPLGSLDTILVPQDLTNEACQVYSIAPAEGNTPVSIFMDKHAEKLAFPILFCGKPRPNNTDRPVNISYSDICKSELRRAGGRMAKNIPNMFFKYQKLQTKHI